MRRRTLLSTPLLLMSTPNLFAGPDQKVQSLSDALRWIDQVMRTPPQMRGVWPLGSVMQHLAQSIEMSVDGFPQPKPRWFQATIGSAAFLVFQWRGRMSHGLAEPIPGAPELDAHLPLDRSAQRLRDAITRFEAQRGSLQPHFAYGALDKSAYAQAHVMHIANHQEEIIAG